MTLMSLNEISELQLLNIISITHVNLPVWKSVGEAKYPERISESCDVNVLVVRQVL